jgi:hypothetical protein
MPSAHYTKLVSTVGAYVGPDKAAEVVARQLKHCTGQPDTFSQDDLKKIINYVTAASSLYVSDKPKREELAAKLKQLAA